MPLSGKVGKRPGGALLERPFDAIICPIDYLKLILLNLLVKVATNNPSDNHVAAASLEEFGGTRRLPHSEGPEVWFIAPIAVSSRKRADNRVLGPVHMRRPVIVTRVAGLAEVPGVVVGRQQHLNLRGLLRFLRRNADRQGACLVLKLLDQLGELFAQDNSSFWPDLVDQFLAKQSGRREPWRLRQ